VIRGLRVILFGCVILAISLAIVNYLPDPWDLVVFVLGATCIPLGIGLVTVKDAFRPALHGPLRVQAVVSLLLGLVVTRGGGRLLLGILGWH
jgi:hypothetical protein